MWLSRRLGRNLEQLTPPALAPPVDGGRRRRSGSRQRDRASRLRLIARRSACAHGCRCQAGGRAILARRGGGGSCGAVLGGGRVPGIQAGHAFSHCACAPRLAQLNGTQVVLSQVCTCEAEVNSMRRGIEFYSWVGATYHISALVSQRA